MGIHAVSADFELALFFSKQIFESLLIVREESILSAGFRSLSSVIEEKLRGTLFKVGFWPEKYTQLRPSASGKI